METFAVAWEKMASFDGRSGLLTWLSRIAYRRFLDAKKHDQRADTFRTRLAEKTTESISVTPIHELVKAEDIARLWQAVANLILNCDWQ